jgi:hypothetical protein
MLIETPPIAIECIPPACDAAVDPMCAMLGVLELDDELPPIAIELDPSAAATLANRSAAASTPTASASVRLPHVLSVATIVSSSLAVHVRVVFRANMGERP